MDLSRIKRQWSDYCGECEANEVVDVDIHFSMALKVGGLIQKAEQLDLGIKKIMEYIEVMSGIDNSPNKLTQSQIDNVYGELRKLVK